MSYAPLHKYSSLMAWKMKEVGETQFEARAWWCWERGQISAFVDVETYSSSPCPV
jgi:hypothetical protein